MYGVRAILAMAHSTLQVIAESLAPETKTPSRNMKIGTVIFSGLWVFAVFGIYLAQFRDLIGPILNALGVRLS